ncbi:hypothetical protein AB0K43_03025 [Kitasatospora sp. NPDC049258]|uniref:hypothetical protein n=1 Tax=Kitasatospora sp. NPDC049258 TaxID=3155394 RepID=UPI00342DF963
MSGSHRKPLPGHLVPLMRAGLVATAAAVMVTGTPVLASAAPNARHTTAHAVSIDTTSAISTASPLHPRDFQVAFEIHQYGDQIGAGADNRALASSRSCDGWQHCSSAALSFQIITMGGSHPKLHAGNVSKASNNHCAACETFAGAYQFVLDTPRPVTLSPDALRRLGQIEADLRTAARDQPPQRLKAVADNLAEQVVVILGEASAAASADRAAPTPDVTLTRTIDGLPASS